eukprot:scaffold277609_cov30-Tisochrysis_lutea.AAC.3
MEYSGFSDFLFWRRPHISHENSWGHDQPSEVIQEDRASIPPPEAQPVPLLSDVPLRISHTPAEESNLPANLGAVAATDSDEQSRSEDEDLDMGEGAVDPGLVSMIQSGSGARLMEMLSGISSRLGSSSRFATAANTLRSGVAAVRQIHGGDESLAATLSGANLDPLSSAPLLHDVETPSPPVSCAQVARSMTSMLQALDDDHLHGYRTISSYPASLQAIELLETLSWQELRSIEPADTCTICLEGLSGGGGWGVRSDDVRDPPLGRQTFVRAVLQRECGGGLPLRGEGVAAVCPSALRAIGWESPGGSLAGHPTFLPPSE